jgi:hypothetical protein
VCWCCTLAWYGGATRAVDLLSGTAVWFHNGYDVVLLPEHLLQRWRDALDFAAYRANVLVRTNRTLADYFTVSGA